MEERFDVAGGEDDRRTSRPRLLPEGCHGDVAYRESSRVRDRTGGHDSVRHVAVLGDEGQPNGQEPADDLDAVLGNVLDDALRSVPCED